MNVNPWATGSGSTYAGREPSVAELKAEDALNRANMDPGPGFSVSGIAGLSRKALIACAQSFDDIGPFDPTAYLSAAAAWGQGRHFVEARSSVEAARVAADLRNDPIFASEVAHWGKLVEGFATHIENNPRDTITFLDFSTRMGMSAADSADQIILGGYGQAPEAGGYSFA